MVFVVILWLIFWQVSFCEIMTDNFGGLSYKPARRQKRQAPARRVPARAKTHWMLISELFL